MATLVTFHAHPDDEAVLCAGTMTKAAAAGHRVVLVFATRGEHGEVPEGLLGPGETLADRRVEETLEAARILGVSRVEFLGYADSGMEGTPENDAPESFWRADVDEAATRLAEILAEERADVLTVYDDHGNYGHPDHVQVHRVGVRAGELAGTRRVYEATFEREAEERVVEWAAANGMDLPVADVELGTPSALITTRVDVRDFAEVKRRALLAHASQISDAWFLFALPEDHLDAFLTEETFVLRGAPPGTRESSLFEGLDG